MGDNGMMNIGNTAIPMQKPSGYYCPLCGKPIRVTVVSYGPIPLQCNSCRKQMELTIKQGLYYAPGTVTATTGG